MFLSLLFILMSSTASSTALAKPTDQQIERVLQLLQSEDSNIRQSALEIVRGSEYLDDERIQRAVTNRFNDSYPSVSTLAVAIIQETSGVPVPILSYIFEKSVLSKSDGGWDSWGQEKGIAFFRGRKGNDIALFRELARVLLRLLEGQYPDFPAHGWTVIAGSFRGLGAEASLVAEFPLLRQILAKAPASHEERMLDQFVESFGAFVQTEQNELLRLFLSSEEQSGLSDSVLARRALKAVATLSLATLEKLGEVFFTGSAYHENHARRMIARSLKNDNRDHARFLAEMAQKAVGNVALSEFIFGEFIPGGFLLLAPNPRAVFDLAMKSALASPANEKALILVIRHHGLMQSSEIASLFTRISNDRFAALLTQWLGYIYNPLEISLPLWRELFRYLDNSDEKARINTIQILNSLIVYSRMNFTGHEETFQEIFALLVSHRQSRYEPVRIFSERKFSQFEPHFKAILTTLPMKVVFQLLEADIRSALKDPFIHSHYRRYPSYMLLKDLRADPNMRWTPEEFRTSWLPFFVEQFRSGDKVVVSNAWTYLALFRFRLFGGGTFWQMEPGDGVADTLRSRFYRGDSPASRASGSILAILAKVEKKPEGLALRREMLALIFDNRPYVLNLILLDLISDQIPEPAVLNRILSLTESLEPEIRGAAFSALALLFATKKIGLDVYKPLIPGIQRALLGPDLTVRAMASSAGWVPREFADLRVELFPEDVVDQLIKDFEGTRERFLRDDAEAAKYFLSFSGSFLPLSPGRDKIVPFEQYPIELMLAAIGSANLDVATRAIRNLYLQQTSVCQASRNRRCGLLTVGNQSMSILVTKQVLDRYAEIARMLPESEEVWQINAMMNSTPSSTDEDKWLFLIREYAAGRQIVRWE